MLLHDAEYAASQVNGRAGVEGVDSSGRAAAVDVAVEAGEVLRGVGAQRRAAVGAASIEEVAAGGGGPATQAGAFEARSKQKTASSQPRALLARSRRW
jgi:hypothetical protein